VHSEAAIAAGFYAEWLANGSQQATYERCIGYDRPLYLGGKDTVANLSATDFEVY